MRGGSRHEDHVMIEGRAYAVRIDVGGTRRFRGNGVLAYLVRLRRSLGTSAPFSAVAGLDVQHATSARFLSGMPKRDVVEFMVAVGYSVDAVTSLPACDGWRIVDPSLGHPVEEPAAPDDWLVPVRIGGVDLLAAPGPDGFPRTVPNAVVLALAGLSHPATFDGPTLDAAQEAGEFTVTDRVAFEAMLGREPGTVAAAADPRGLHGVAVEWPVEDAD